MFKKIVVLCGAVLTAGSVFADGDSLLDILSANIGGTLTAVLQVLAALLGIAVILVSLFIALKLTRNAFYKT